MLIPLEDVIIGLYIGILSGIFPAFVAFLLGFSFKYFTDVTVPGLGVVMLCGAIAGVSGGLMGILDPQIAESWTGITAIIVILMGCLWAHSIGDKLGAETPRKFTIERFRESVMTADLVERVDSYGQLRVQPVGDIADVEGYPPLPQELRQKIKSRSWRFPADLPLPALEDRLESQLLDEFELAEVSVSIDRRGQARIAAAPTAGTLSRRVPSGMRAVSIDTLLPTGVARQDEISLVLPDRTVHGTVLSARTYTSQDEPETHESGEREESEVAAAPRAPTTTGGEGRVTVSVSRQDARALLEADFAPMVVHARGTRREYEAIAVLHREGNRFRKFVLGETSNLVGETIGDADVRRTYGVIVVTARRGPEVSISPESTFTFEKGDELIVVGPRSGLRRFEEVTA